MMDETYCPTEMGYVMSYPVNKGFSASSKVTASLPRKKTKRARTQELDDGVARFSEKSQQPATMVEISSNSNLDADSYGYTKLPNCLDEKFEKLDPNALLRPTIVKVDGNFEKTCMQGLIGGKSEVFMFEAGP